MGKPKPCEKCGQLYELSRRDAALRTMVGLNAKLFPAMAAACDLAKNYCNACWKAALNPVAKGMLGAMEKEESEKAAAENTGPPGVKC